MKRKNNIYSQICNYENILDIYNTIKKNIRNKEKIIKFEEFHTFYITKIYNDLINKTYTPGRYNIFLIKRPKYRIVMGQNLYDKIVNHLAAKYFISNIVESSLIDVNVATRKNKGTHFGIKILKKYLVKILNEDAKVYALKVDVSKFFYSIDHDIVKQLLNTKIKDTDVLNLITKILSTTDESYVNEKIAMYKKIEIERINKSNLNLKIKNKLLKEITKIPFYEKGKGLPIGNMTSQVLAVFYLNELDHYMKEKMHSKYYIRYMDDIVILSTDKQYLVNCLSEIKSIMDKYKLKLNNKTTIIDASKNGIDFLGFHFYIKGKKIIMKVRNSTKKKLNFYSKYDKLKVKSSFESHLKHGNCYGLYKKNMG